MCKAEKIFKNSVDDRSGPANLVGPREVGLSIRAAQFLKFLGLQIELDLVPSKSRAWREIVRAASRPEATFSFLCSEIWRKSLFENLILEFPRQAGLLLLAQGSPTDGRFWNGQIAPVTAGAIVSKN